MEGSPLFMELYKLFPIGFSMIDSLINGHICKFWTDGYTH